MGRGTRRRKRGGSVNSSNSKGRVSVKDHVPHAEGDTDLLAEEIIALSDYTTQLQEVSDALSTSETSQELTEGLDSQAVQLCASQLTKDLKGCQGGHDCLGTEGVLRVSFGCFIFHFIMFLTTVGTTKLYEYRASWHSGLWPLKFFMWILFLLMPFLLPSTFIQLYGEVARFGAGIFLLIQLISVVKFITWWNDHWMSDDAGHRRVPAIMVSTTAYSASVCGIILMYISYAPTASCSLNIFFITCSLVLLQIMTGISLHSKANAGLLASGLMGLYIVFLCWSAIRSEPTMDNCNVRKQPAGKGDWITIVSFIIALFAIVTAAFSAGIDSRVFRFRKSEFQSEYDIPYGYGFFHFVFAMAAMYFAMLFVGWNLHQSMEKWSIDVGWASTWVKIVNEWLAASLYIWILISAFIEKRNDYPLSNV